MATPKIRTAKKQNRKSVTQKSVVQNKKKSARKSDERSIGSQKPPMGLKNVFFRPERMTYVKRPHQERRLITEKDCVFCLAVQAFDHQTAASAEDRDLVIAASQNAFMILNKYPYNSGHLLVLPRRHVASLTELSRDEVVETQALIRFAIEAAQETTSAQGFNVGLNLGAAAGAGLPTHLHWHVIPRWSGDLNFFPLIAETKVVVETLEQTRSRIQVLIQSKLNQWLSEQSVAD